MSTCVDGQRRVGIYRARTIIFTIVLLSAAATQASTLSVVGPGPASLGNPFSLNISADLTEPSNGGRIFITYDPVFWQFDNFAFDAGPWNDGGGFDIAQATDDGAGSVDLRVSAGFDSFTGLQSVGSLTLIALAPTASTLVGFSETGIPSTSRWGLDGTPIALSFSEADVAIVPVPVPAAFWLLGSALGLLGWMRQR